VVRAVSGAAAIRQMFVTWLTLSPPMSHKCAAANCAIQDKTPPFKAVYYLGLDYLAINGVPE